MGTDSDIEWRSKIFNLVDQYLNSKPKENFVPGKTWVNVLVECSITTKS